MRAITRWALVLTWHPHVAPTTRADVTAHLTELSGHGILSAHGGLHRSPALHGHGHATVHMTTAPGHTPHSHPTVAQLSTLPAAGLATAVSYPLQPLYGSPGDHPDAHPDALRRTLLLVVQPQAEASAVTRLEVLLAGLPPRIPAITAWQVSRVGPAAGPDASHSPAWTHALDHTLTSTHDMDLTSAYMTDPYHLTAVDPHFDPCDPRCIVTHLSHTWH